MVEGAIGDVVLATNEQREELLKAYEAARECLREQKAWRDSGVFVPWSSLSVLVKQDKEFANDASLRRTDSAGPADAEVKLPRARLVRLLRKVADVLSEGMAADESHCLRLRRLEVSLLGADGLPKSVALSQDELAGALLRGMTALWPSKLDPIFEMVSQAEEFNTAWSDLLEEPKTNEPAGDRWGVGPVGAWSMEDRLVFKSASGHAPGFSEDGHENTCIVCPGSAPQLGFGNAVSKDKRGACAKAMRAAGHCVALFEPLHRELSTVAEDRPGELVQLQSQLPGLLGAFARFNPQVGNFSGCGTTFLDIFAAGYRPGERNVAVLLACLPRTGIHTGLSHANYLRALYFTGMNITCMIREYNAMAMHEDISDADKAAWRKADLKAQVEYYFSDRNMLSDPYLVTMLKDSTIWCDVAEIAEGVASEEEIMLALRDSETVATRVRSDGKADLRPAPARVLPELGKPMAKRPPTKRKLPEDEGASEEPTDKGADVEGSEKPQYSATQPPPKQAQRGLYGRGRNMIFLPGTLLSPRAPPGVEGGTLKPTPPSTPPPGVDGHQSTADCEAKAKAMPRSRSHEANPAQPEVQGGVAEDTPSTLTTGTEAFITGLTAQTAFNDQPCIVGDFDSRTWRWSVRLQDGSTLKVREDNLTLEPPRLKPEVREPGYVAPRAKAKARISPSDY